MDGHFNPNYPKSIKIHRPVWLDFFLGVDSVLYSIAQRIEHVATCTKSIKLHWLLFVGFSTPQYIAQRIEHVATCTKSIKLHRLLLLDSGLCTAKPWMLCICYCTNSIGVQQLGYLFTAC